MKITFLLFTGLLIISFFRIDHKNTPLEEITVQIKFGTRPGFCQGTGLCTLEPPGEQPASIPDAQGSIRLNSQGRLVLEVAKNSISVAKATEQFGNGYFLISEVLQLSEEIQEGLSLDEEQARILTGSYGVEEDVDFYTVTFIPQD